jgi:hypothetical protein
VGESKEQDSAGVPDQVSRESVAYNITYIDVADPGADRHTCTWHVDGDGAGPASGIGKLAEQFSGRSMPQEDASIPTATSKRMARVIEREGPNSSRPGFAFPQQVAGRYRPYPDTTIACAGGQM